QGHKRDLCVVASLRLCVNSSTTYQRSNKHMRRVSSFLFLILFTLSLIRTAPSEGGQGQALPLRLTAMDAIARSEVTEILRDEYGVPHVFAPTLETAAFAVGYAQAEDRLEELLKNYRKAEGTMSEAFGPEWFQ